MKSPPRLSRGSFGLVDFVRLHRHADKGSALRELAQLAGTDVGASRAQPAEDLLHGRPHRPATLDQHFLAFGGAVLGNAAGIFLHRRIRAHAVEALVALALALDGFARALVMA